MANFVFALSFNQVRYETIDGSMEENKEKRNALFAISGVRGKYPQVFIDDKYIGDWEVIEGVRSRKGEK